MTKDEALKLAHEALKKFHYAMIDAGVLDRQEVLNEGFTAATAIKEALANVATEDTSQERVDEMQKQRHEQEPPPWWPAVENILNEYGLQAIDFVAEFKKALAQPEQEPVAYQDTAEKCRLETVPANGTLFHTTPPQRTWQGLTNNDLQPIAEEYRILFGSWVHDFARAIETKLKEKNSA